MNVQFKCRGACVAIGIALVGCSVQLTAPYDADIDKDTMDLQKDFFIFVANMQTSASTPKGYYDVHASEYDDFEARLAVVRLRSESLSGGLPCGKAIEAAEKAGSHTVETMAPMVKAALSGSSASSDTCVTILTKLAQQQMESLRQIHEKACRPTTSGSGIRPDPQCVAIFSTPPLFSVVSNEQSDAPAVSAVAVVLNELVRQEHSMKPPANA